MNWIDIASIVFVCVTANHLGLIEAILELVPKWNILSIVSCTKCLTFWFTLTYGMWEMGPSIIPQIPMVLAISFLASYIALWLELFEAYIDTLYMKLYGKIYETSDDTPATDADAGDSAGTVPEL